MTRAPRVASPQSMKTPGRFFIMRHGETVYNAARRLQTRTFTNFKANLK